MKIAVIGPGAMGCLYGGLLTQAGEDVWLVHVREDHVAVLNRDGVFITSDTGTVNIPVKATTDPAIIGPVDLILVFVKSGQTQAAISRVSDLIGPHTVLMTLQNGLGNHEIIADMWGQERVLAGTTSFGAAAFEPGRVRLNGIGKSCFGELDGRLTPRLQDLVAVFDRAGLNPEASTEPLKLIWDKLFVNVGINALTAIANVKNGQLLDIPPLTILLEQAVTEASQVATKAGINFSPDPVKRTKEIARLTATNISSMRQDILQGRPTEVAMMNEAIIRLGRHYGIPTPVNETLTYLVQALTARDAATGPPAKP